MKTTDRHISPGVTAPRVILVTGSTGNIGAAVLARLLREEPAAELILLVRAESADIAWRRVEDVVEFLTPGFDLSAQRHRITILTGDITHPLLGLTETMWRQVALRVTEIVHAAAATKFLLPLECARKINVEGAANVLRLAQAAYRTGRLRQLVHVSTAFVCGDRAGIIRETDTVTPAGFSNHYEQSKWEGEQLVRRHMNELPIAVVRPSIVVGDSHTGRTTAFNVLYTPLKMIHDGRLNFIPGRSDAHLDVVPLDYVADAITYVALHHQRTVGRTFNLTAGAGRTMTAQEIVSQAQQIYRQCGAHDTPTKARFVSPRLCGMVRRLMRGRVRRMWQLAEPYLPYLSVKRQFVNDNAETVLHPAGIRPPALQDYLSTILAFAIETEWGRCRRQHARAA